MTLFCISGPFARAIPRRSDLELELGRHVSVRYHQEENNGGPIRPQSAVHQRPTTEGEEERGRAEEGEGEGASRKRARSLSPPDAKVRLEEEEVDDGGEKEDKFEGAAASRRKR